MFVFSQASSGGEGNNSDLNSLSSDMLDIILQEDSCSATSGSMGSGSNGCGTSASGTSNSGTSQSRESASGTSGSGTGLGFVSKFLWVPVVMKKCRFLLQRRVFPLLSGSNSSSNYFGSVDSSQNSKKVKSHSSSREGRPMEIDQSEQLIKCVLQDPLWLVTDNTDEKVMMTYQLPSRWVAQSAHAC